VDASAANRAPPALRPGIAERLWDASRVEFSLRGYHGARVRAIARRAGCNVALLYRHWSSKKALYLELLRSIWQGMLREIVSLMEGGSGAPAVVGASAHEASRPFFELPVQPEAWRRHLYDLLLHGLMACPPADGAAKP